MINTLLKGEKAAAEVAMTMITGKGADLEVRGKDGMTKSSPTGAIHQTEKSKASSTTSLVDQGSSTNILFFAMFKKM